MALLEALFVGSVLVAMLSLLFMGWKTPEIVVFLALVLVWNAGTISTEDALSGFSNPGVLAVGSLFVVIKGVERSRLADRAAKHVFGLRTTLAAGLLRLMGLAFLLSAFLNNTPVVALLIPITKDWAATRGFPPSVLLMPLSFACIFGGLVTIIGTSTNLVVQGLVIEAGQADPTIRGLGFFEPGYIGLPLGVVGMLYLAVAAPRVLTRAETGGNGGGSGRDRGGGGGGGGDGERAEELLTEVQVSHDFAHLGKSVALVLARLGLPAEALVGIRRGLPGVVNATAAAIPSQGEEGRSDVGVGGANVTSNLQYPGRRKRSGERWDSKVEGLPLSAGTGTGGPATSAGGAALGGGLKSATLRHRLSGTEGSIAAAAAAAAPLSSTLSQSHAQAPTRKSSSLQLLGPPAREGETDRSDSTQPLSPLEQPVRDGDVLVFSCPRATMVSFQGSVLSEGVGGLEILGSTTAELQKRAKLTATKSAELVELVLSDCNHFVGRSPAGPECALVASRYGCLILAVRRALTVAAAASAAVAVVDKSRQCTEEEKRRYLVEEHEGGRTAFDAENGAAGRCRSGSFFSLDRDMEGGVSSPLHAGEKKNREQQQQQQRTARLSACAVAQDVDPMDAAAAAATVVATAAEAEHSARGVEAAIVRPLVPGDIVLVVANDGFSETWKDAPEFDLVTWLGAVPKAVTTYDYLSLLVFCGMLGWVLFSSVTMVRAAFAAGGVLMLGGWVDPKKSVGYVDWALLLLVGSALGLSKAIANSGLAGYAGNAIKESGMSASASLYLLYGFTMICTELITNNAAAALAIPIALSIAKELEVSYKPFVLTVMMAASSSFITPIGYQTNTMVWAPGGYEFSDFVRLGTPLSLIYMVCGSFFMPRLFPF
ncbi:unnamed protein product [Pylaiella littoralis]